MTLELAQKELDTPISAGEDDLLALRERMKERKGIKG